MCSYGGQVVVVAHGDICHAGGLTPGWASGMGTSPPLTKGRGANLGSIFASLSWPGSNRTVVEHLMPKEMVMSTVVAVTTLMSLS